MFRHALHNVLDMSTLVRPFCCLWGRVLNRCVIYTLETLSLYLNIFVHFPVKAKLTLVALLGVSEEYQLVVFVRQPVLKALLLLGMSNVSLR